ncbi:hypothetical protein [Collinsella sp. An271]|uniref:hypothetical protein n=1 Tax=Collinsella sp. An271 TaxID=1965616 RepID=UPI00117E7FED|nr:hypothetical protein [Collinsella sp. An271]
MSQTNLILVSTTFHAHVASQLIDEYFSDDQNVILSSSSISSRALRGKEETDSRFESFRVIHVEFSSQGTFPKQSLALLLISLLLAKIKCFPSGRVRSMAGINPSRIIVFSPNAVSLMVRALYPQAEVYLCEEGLGSYDGSILRRIFYLDNKGDSSTALSRILSFVNGVCFQGNLLLNPRGIFMHQPTLVTANYPFPIIKIGRNAKSERQTDKREVDSPAGHNWQIIFLGQAVKGGLCNHVKRDDSLFAEVSCYFPQVIYRKHPRDKRFYSDRKLDEALDWESFCANIDANSTVLISDFSTAATVPKLLGDKEPWLLFLFDYKTDDESALSPKLSEFFERFLRSYDHHQRIMTPRSPEELREACMAIRHLIEKESGTNER